MSDPAPWYRRGSNEAAPDITFDYDELERLLSEELWLAAYEETQRAVRYVAGEARCALRNDLLYIDHIISFPCAHLCKIDELWSAHTDHRHGLAIQNRIYQELGGTECFDHETWILFLDRVGWNRELDLSLDSPPGHMPWLLSPAMVALDSYDGYSRWRHSGHDSGKTLFLFGVFFDRLQVCGL